MAIAAVVKFLEAKASQGIIDVLCNYIHPGKICFYEGVDAEPRTLVDMGAFHANPENKGTFRSVKYRPVGRKEIAIELELLWHGAPKLGIKYDDHLLH
jgi:hypothetical protein